MNFQKQAINSIFDKEYDYIISIGHRCCVALANGYGRKSSFPFDWQITKIHLLPTLFKNELLNFYPNSGVQFVHEYHKENEQGKSLGVDVELTLNTFERRCTRLVNLLKKNERRLLFVRSKYNWYWSKQTHNNQEDQNSKEYDLEQLSSLSTIIANQYNNNKTDFLYIYGDLVDEDLFDRDPSCKKSNLQWGIDGTINSEDLVLPAISEQLQIAEGFSYLEMPSDNNIHAVKVEMSGVRVEAMCYNSKIFDRLKISSVKDF